MATRDGTELAMVQRTIDHKTLHRPESQDIPSGKDRGRATVVLGHKNCTVANRIGSSWTEIE
eukprot:m.24940 g.24940  ORF g.24940 m.24940 type:complete len:62 (-) comp6135_c0_seq1:3-188(-)